MISCKNIYAFSLLNVERIPKTINSPADASVEFFSHQSDDTTLYSASIMGYHKRGEIFGCQSKSTSFSINKHFQIKIYFMTGGLKQRSCFN